MRVRSMLFVALVSMSLMPSSSEGQTWKELLSEANLLAKQKNYDSALVIAYRALADVKTNHGETDSSCAMVYHRIGTLQQQRGKSDSALILYTKALSIWESLSNANPLEMAKTNNNLGALYADLEEFLIARKYYERSLQLKRLGTGIENEHGVGATLFNLGNLNLSLGRFQQAEEYYRQVIVSCKRIGPAANHRLAFAQNHLGNLFQRTGRFALAKEMYVQSLKSQAIGHSDSAQFLNNFGVLFFTLGEYSKAESLWTIVIEMDRQQRVQALENTPTTFSNLGAAYLRQHKLTKADSLLSYAVASSKQLGFDHTLEYARTLTYLGETKRDLGQLPASDSLFALATDIWGAYLPPTHQDIATLKLKRSSTLWLMAQSEKALQYAENGFGSLRANAREVASIVPESNALEYALSMHEGIDQLLSMYSMSHQSALKVATAIINTKGLISDVYITRNRNQERKQTPYTQSLLDTLGFLRHQLSSSFSRADVHSWKLLDSIRTRISFTENEINLQLASSKPSSINDSISANDLRKAIPQNAALLEFFRWKRFSPKLDNPTSVYSVLVMDSGTLKIIELGHADKLDKLIGRYRKHFLELAQLKRPISEKDQAIFNSISSQLYTLIWKPIAGHIKPNNTLFIAPDGGLNLISFAGLINPKGKYLIEEHPIHYLSAGRDLIRLSQDSTISGTGLLAFGDPDYDATATMRFASVGADSRPPLPPKDAYAVRNVRSGCGMLSEMKVGRLPNTKLEVDAIANYFPSSKIFEGRAASEENFKNNAAGRKVIHLATHGYYISGECGQKSGQKSDTFAGENPLLESGVFLAGANLHGSDIKNNEAEDGIVTALEVSAMDLRGTDLVVLSACETGLGKIEQGEGVYGLRRAFQMAGAKTVISSLWQVPDRETTKFMRELYDRMSNAAYRSFRRMTYYELMQKGALQRIAELRARGRPTHPYTWGGFVATGDWKIR